jgi:hypothetical protein
VAPVRRCPRQELVEHYLQYVRFTVKTEAKEKEKEEKKGK